MHEHTHTESVLVLLNAAGDETVITLPGKTDITIIMSGHTPWTLITVTIMTFDVP